MLVPAANRGGSPRRDVASFPASTKPQCVGGGRRCATVLHRKSGMEAPPGLRCELEMSLLNRGPVPFTLAFFFAYPGESKKR